ncbi:hypothetical protein niasHS_009157 [Heterodera schachtii]|uniref:NADH dehydrogenase [ubiquinone] 1 alpha subcomplex assembly factor 3 n=1 Tax=Heterodera schachtii TaxID=97005 RepID=A0ABD2JE54_HETSC
MFVARSQCCAPVTNSLKISRSFAVPWRQFFDKLKADRLKVKDKPLDDDHNRYADDEWHWMPTGESDIQNQATVTFLSRTLKKEKLVAIKTISKFGFRTHENAYLLGPIAVFPKTVLSWRVPMPADITPESLELFFMLQPKLDLLIVGVGDREDVDAVRHRLMPAFKREQLAYEILPTEEAIPTFNFLNGVDNRYVAAALYPPANIQISAKESSATTLQLSGRFEEFSTPDCHFHMLDSPQPITTVCEKIWGYTDEAVHAMKAITALREEKLKMREEQLEQKILKDKQERQDAYAASAEKRRLQAEQELEDQRKEWKKLSMKKDSNNNDGKIDDK